MTLSQKTLILMAVILNFLVAYAMLFHQQPLNVDGIIYINAAQNYLNEGIKGAMAIYPWPFYSIIIAATSQISHLSLLHSGLLINAILTSILVITFILLIKELGGTLREQALGLLIILIYPYLAHSRYNVLRDFGYYAFFLVSFFYLLRYLRVNKWYNSIGFNLSIIVATLFRVEGIFLLCFAPLIVLLKDDRTFFQRILSTIKLYLPSLLICLGLIGLALIVENHTHIHHTPINLGRINDIIHSLQQGPVEIENVFISKKALIQQLIVSAYGQDYADMFLTGGIIALFISTLFATLGAVYAALIFYLFCTKKMTTDKNVRLAFCSYLSIITITLFIFILQQFFLAGRYIVPLCLLIMLVIPFALSDLINNRSKNLRATCLFILALIALIYTTFDAFGQYGTSNTYIMTAGLWLKENTPTQSRLYSNDPQLVFYSERAGTPYVSTTPPDTDWLMAFQHIQLNNYDYIALNIKHDKSLQEQQAESILKLSPIHRWTNNRGDSIILFKITSLQNNSQHNESSLQPSHNISYAVISTRKMIYKAISSSIHDFLSVFHS